MGDEFIDEILLEVLLLLTSAERIVKITRRTFLASQASKVRSTNTWFVQRRWKTLSFDRCKLVTVTH